MTGGVFAVSASAGGLHSAVVDSAGKVWTWGGGGHGACLGHGECSDEALAPRGARQIRAYRMNKRMGGGVVGRVGGEGEVRRRSRRTVKVKTAALLRQQCHEQSLAGKAASGYSPHSLRPPCINTRGMGY